MAATATKEEAPCVPMDARTDVEKMSEFVAAYLGLDIEYSAPEYDTERGANNTCQIGRLYAAGEILTEIKLIPLREQISVKLHNSCGYATFPVSIGASNKQLGKFMHALDAVKIDRSNEIATANKVNGQCVRLEERMKKLVKKAGVQFTRIGNPVSQRNTPAYGHVTIHSATDDSNRSSVPGMSGHLAPEVLFDTDEKLVLHMDVSHDDLRCVIPHMVVRDPRELSVDDEDDEPDHHKDVTPKEYTKTVAADLKLWSGLMERGVWTTGGVFIPVTDAEMVKVIKSLGAPKYRIRGAEDVIVVRTNKYGGSCTMPTFVDVG